MKMTPDVILIIVSINNFLKTMLSLQNVKIIKGPFKTEELEISLSNRIKGSYLPNIH